MTPLAYHRTVALAHACGLDWAMAALGEPRPCTIHESAVRGGYGWSSAYSGARWPVPERIEDIHAPYLADCERRGVHPGELPATLRLATPITDADIAWRVEDDGHARIWMMPSGVAVDVHSGPGPVVQIDSTGMTPDDLARLSELVTAVAKADAATRTP